MSPTVDVEGRVARLGLKQVAIDWVAEVLLPGASGAETQCRGGIRRQATELQVWGSLCATEKAGGPKEARRDAMRPVAKRDAAVQMHFNPLYLQQSVF